MNRILKKFLQRGVDLSPVGVELREDNTNYFCTPKGASVFGWAGIDGIHFCFIRGFGEMVFSVSPMNTSPDYVHPVAENFTDFLRLILACGDVAAVEQAWMWNEAQFEAFLNENPTTPGTTANFIGNFREDEFVAYGTTVDIYQKPAIFL